MGITKSDGSMLTGLAAFSDHYSSWASANGLGAKLGAFVEGSANMIASLGISKTVAIAIMGVFVVSFAATTLDTATRIQRYVIAELADTINLRRAVQKNRATFLAVGTAMGLAFYTGDGKGAMALWPIFGAVNQLLAGLALLAITSYLVHHNRPLWTTVPPMIFMVVMTTWAMAGNLSSLWGQGKIFLAALSGLILFLQGWMLFESFFILKGKWLSARISAHPESAKTP